MSVFGNYDGDVDSEVCGLVGEATDDKSLAKEKRKQLQIEAWGPFLSTGEAPFVTLKFVLQKIGLCSDVETI